MKQKRKPDSIMERLFGRRKWERPVLRTDTDTQRKIYYWSLTDAAWAILDEREAQRKKFRPWERSNRPAVSGVVSNIRNSAMDRRGVRYGSTWRFVTREELLDAGGDCI